MRDHMHSKFMAFQVLSLLTEDSRKSLEMLESQYKWTSPDGREVEFDGLTVVALIMSRCKPSIKFDMFKEIGEAKALTLASFDWNLVDYFDAMRRAKTLIDQKDRTAYTEDAFIRDIYAQLKTAPVETFANKYDLQETDWLMGSVTITADMLMDGAEVYYNSLVDRNLWNPEHSSKAQIIALTTQIQNLKSELSSVKSQQAAAPALPPKSPTRTPTSSSIDPWRLQKQESGKEFSQIEADGKTSYWCEDGHFFNGKRVGMYCLHRPGDGHKKWQERKDRRKKRDKTASATPAGTPTKTAPNANDGEQKKLSLAQHLQAALMTNAGLSEDQFQQFWSDACKASGN